MREQTLGNVADCCALPCTKLQTSLVMTTIWSSHHCAHLPLQFISGNSLSKYCSLLPKYINYTEPRLFMPLFHRRSERETWHDAKSLTGDRAIHSTTQQTMNYLSKLVKQNTGGIRWCWNWALVVLNYSRTKACSAVTYCREESAVDHSYSNMRKHKIVTVLGSLAALPNGFHMRVDFF